MRYSYAPASRSMTGGIRYVACFAWEVSPASCLSAALGRL